MKGILIVGVLCMLYLNPQTMDAQTNPSIETLQNFFNGQQLLLTYREGEVVYGTYYFLEVHYCPNGYYGLYGNTVKQTVLGNEQKSIGRSTVPGRSLPKTASMASSMPH